MTPPGAPGYDTDDAYVAYIRDFFDRWTVVYDWFAWPIASAYAATVRRAGAAPGRAILDVCTGTGEIAVRCARRGATVTAIDMTPSMLERARRKASARALPIAFRLMDARRLDFDDRTFDVAILSFALHDMPRAARVETVREAARVARDAVLVLDYDVPRHEPWRSLVAAGIGLYETAYFPDFVRLGLDPVLDAAGVTLAETTRPLPGFCALHVLRGG